MSSGFLSPNSQRLERFQKIVNQQQNSTNFQTENNYDGIYNNQLQSNLIDLLVKEECLICQQSKDQKHFLEHTINFALHVKYSQSDDLFFKRDINGLLNQWKSPKVIQIQDDIIFHDPTEYLRRMYLEGELLPKLQAFGNFYKYHPIVPRIFLKSHGWIMDKYHCRKKTVGFKDIAKQIKKELALENKCPEDENMEYLNNYKTIYIEELQTKYQKGQIMLKNLNNQSSIIIPKRNYRQILKDVIQNQSKIHDKTQLDMTMFDSCCTYESIWNNLLNQSKNLRQSRIMKQSQSPGKKQLKLDFQNHKPFKKFKPQVIKPKYKWQDQKVTPQNSIIKNDQQQLPRLFSQPNSESKSQ